MDAAYQPISPRSALLLPVDDFDGFAAAMFVYCSKDGEG
jgi:hypothetical protein